MIPTWIGLVLLAIGAWLLLRGSVMNMFTLVIASSLLGGSAAIQLPALGGSSVLPVYVALGLLVARIALAPGPVAAFVGRALSANAALAVFCGYGVAGALVLPQIFEGAMEVVPLTPRGIRHLFDTFPLGFTNQNITTAVYLAGTLLAAMAGWIVAQVQGAPQQLSRILAWTGLAHVALGVVALLMTVLGLGELIWVIRNGNYAQLEQSYAGLIRVAGFFPETSGYAGYGVPLMVLCCEMWLRDIRPRLSGLAALALLVILTMSTSSTAYVGIAAYGLILAVRFLVLPTALAPRKLLTLAGIGGAGLFAVCIIALAAPGFAASFTDMLMAMTVDKSTSDSGEQRAFWARQGIEAFQVSMGLGIGAGSFRSSSLPLAIAGSMGIVGLVSFAVYLWTMFRPLSASTYSAAGAGPALALAGAFAWAAMIGIVVASIMAPSPDPGIMFALYAGLALGLRAAARSDTVAAAHPAPAHRVRGA